MSSADRRGGGSRAPGSVALAILLAIGVADRSAVGDGGALVARGEVGGAAAAVFILPVPPRVGEVEVEAVGRPWRESPPRIEMRLGDLLVSASAEPCPEDPLASRAVLVLPEAGTWALRVESAAGWLEARIPVAAAPPPWRARLPWMLLWVPALLLLGVRARLRRAAN
jgi:hypothetical protein